MLRLIGKDRLTVNPSQILALDQLGGRVDLANRLHGQLRSTNLMQQNLNEGTWIDMMWIPMAIKSAEACRGQGLIDWRIGVQPWIAFCNHARIGCKFSWEGRVQEIGITGTTAMMEQ